MYPKARPYLRSRYRAGVCARDNQDNCNKLVPSLDRRRSNLFRQPDPLGRRLGGRRSLVCGDAMACGKPWWASAVLVVRRPQVFHCLCVCVCGSRRLGAQCGGPTLSCSSSCTHTAATSEPAWHRRERSARASARGLLLVAAGPDRPPAQHTIRRSAEVLWGHRGSKPPVPFVDARGAMPKEAWSQVSAEEVAGLRGPAQRARQEGPPPAGARPAPPLAMARRRGQVGSAPQGLCRGCA